jgi:hypothetical protein
MRSSIFTALAVAAAALSLTPAMANARPDYHRTSHQHHARYHPAPHDNHRYHHPAPHRQDMHRQAPDRQAPDRQASDRQGRDHPVDRRP